MRITNFFIFIISIIGTTCQADTHYVSDSSGVDIGLCISKPSPCKTLRFAFGKMDGGDTLEIAAGTYSGSENSMDTYNNSNFIPNGSVGGYTIIKAETDGSVNISAPFLIGLNNSYIQIEGLKFSYTGGGKGIAGHHIKVFRTAFQGGPPTGNNTVFSLGTNDQTPGSHHILLEDIWSYGEGGRYNILIYNSEDIVVRRAVIRHDAGWTFDGSNPEAGINIYNSRRVHLQNVIVLDSISDNNGQSWATAFYNVKNHSSNTVHENTKIVGSIAFNNPIGTAFAYEGGGTISNAILENSVSYNNASGITTNSSPVTLEARNLTFVSGNGDGFAEYSDNSTVNISNTIVHEHNGTIFRNISSQTNNNCNYGCSLNHNAATSGLLYLPRIEDGSILATAGSPSGQVGAQIVSIIGESGTYYGDANFDTEQGALWPWPNESRIFDDFCAIRSDGLCDGNSNSLTDYIWSALGNSTPVDLQPMPRPTGVSIIKN